MKTLNYIPLPMLDESPSSMIRRLATMNGYSSVSKLTAGFFGYGFKAHGQSLVQGNRYESLILSQVGQTLQYRIHNGFYPLANADEPGGSFLLGKLKIGRRLLRANFFPACSDCRKAEHFHYINDLCLCSYCPIHQRKLLDTCPSCKRILRLRHLGHQSCTCGATWESPTCSEDECLPEKRLLEILEQQDQKKFNSLFSAIHMFGIAGNKINRASHLIFDAASSVVFEDCARLAKLLPVIWDSIDSTLASVLELRLKKNHPKLAYLLDKLPTKSATKEETLPTKPIRGNALRMILGLGTPLWSQFRKAHPEYDKHSFDGTDIAQIVLALEKFRANNQMQQIQFEKNICSTCHSLKTATKILGLSVQELHLLSRQKILVPTTTIRTSPYYKKGDVTAFQNSYVSTRALASQFKISIFEMITALNRCETVNPIFSRTGHPFLIRSEDVAAVSVAIATIPQKTNSLKGKKKIRRCFMGNLKTCNLDEAAAILNTNRNTTIYYRDIGLIQCSFHDTRTFLLEDVECFYDRYATPRTLSKEFGISHNKLHCILEAHNVSAISGKLVNGHSITVYDRSHFPKNLKELLNPTNDTFGICSSQNKLFSIREAAKAAAIKYSDMKRIAQEEIRPARATLYRPYMKISHDEVIALRAKLVSLTPLTQILEAYNLTHRTFFRRFIAKGFVHPQKYNNREFLDQGDAQKINSFMSEYCTLSDASRILGLCCHHVGVLAKQKNINLYRVADYGFRYPLLKREDLQAVLTNQTSTKRRT